MGFVNFLIIAALIVTTLVLVLGLRSMSIGGDYDRSHSEKFMWERVGMQALVIVLLVAAVVLGNT